MLVSIVTVELFLLSYDLALKLILELVFFFLEISDVSFIYVELHAPDPNRELCILVDKTCIELVIHLWMTK